MRLLGRRNFLKNISAIGTFSFFGAKNIFAQEMAVSTSDGGKGSEYIVKNIEIFRVAGENKKKALYIKAISEEGVEGLYGPIDEEAAIFADRYLKKLLIGESSLSIGANWQKMFLSSRHSRGSYFLIGMSAIDNLLWDLCGKIHKQPVYKLLGGKRNKIAAYGSCYNYSLEPEKMQASAAELKQQGYVHQKWFLTKKGPSYGPGGLQADINSVRLLREAVGDDVDIMIDASRRWDMAYAKAWCKGVEKYNIRWLEEPFQSVNLEAITELSEYTSVPIAMGEHFYGRWDVQKYLEAKSLTVIQADPEWTGGISELEKICTLASIYDVQVIPHGHSMLAAMHLIASQPTDICPLAEYQPKKMDPESYYYFDKNPPVPVNGFLEISDRAGFGIELDQTKIKDIKTVTWREI